MTKKTRRRFAVGIRIKGEVSANIVADSLEDAVAQARQLKMSDLVTVDDGWNDYDTPEVRSVWEND